MSSIGNDARPPSAAVFWIIWFALVNGLCMILFFVVGGIPEGSNIGKPPAWILALCLGLAVISVSIRFLLIPKIKEITKLMTAMMVGMALAEGIGMFGMFLLSKDFPETRMMLFVTSISVMVTFAPIYVNALLSEKKDESKSGRS